MSGACCFPPLNPGEEGGPEELEVPGGRLLLFEGREFKQLQAEWWEFRLLLFQWR